MPRLQHIRGAITNPQSGTPTSLFYELLETIVSDVDAAQGSDDLSEFTLLSDSSAELANLLVEFNTLLANFNTLLANFNTYTLDVVEVAAGDTSYTTTGNSIVICNNTAPATVTLDATPSDGDRVYIKRRVGKVTISGSIDGKTKLVLPLKYQCPLLVYSAAAGEWSLI